MLTIRLQRTGRRNHAEFRVVLAEHKRSAKTGNFLAVLGNYNPHTNTVNLQADAIKEWIGKGAQPSDTVHNLLVKNGIIKGATRNVLPKKTVQVKEEEATEKTEVVATGADTEAAQETTEPVESMAKEEGEDVKEEGATA